MTLIVTTTNFFMKPEKNNGNEGVFFPMCKRTFESNYECLKTPVDKPLRKTLFYLTR